MPSEYLFMIGEGVDKMLLVMTRDRMRSTIETLKQIDKGWDEDHDFAYMAFTGQLSQKRSGEYVDGAKEDSDTTKE